MHYLVTGGAGFIGSHLTEYLLSLGHQVTVIDNLVTGQLSNLGHLPKEKLSFYQEDIRTSQHLPQVIEQVDGVFHLAAMVGVKNIIEKTLDSLLNNTQATERVAELCAHYQKKVIFSSSSEVYGQSEKSLFSETDNLHLGSSQVSRWSYASSKLTEEHLFFAYAKEQDLPVVVVRLFNTVGARQSADYGMVIPTFIRQALSDQDLSVYGDGTQQRCFCDVADVVTALEQLMSLTATDGQLVNIGSQELTSVNDLAAQVIQLTQSKSRIVHIPYKELQTGFADMKYRKPDLTKIQQLINYSPRYTLTEIIQRMVLAERKK